MKKQLLLLMALGLTTSVLSQSLWAIQLCNADIVITKPVSIYIDNLDGTVTDAETSLMWQKCSLGQTWNPGANANDGSDDSCDGTAARYNWKESLEQASNDSSYSYSDWRLPNKNELLSLVEGACESPSINETLFPDTVSDWYWSASPYADYDLDVWLVYFRNGPYGPDTKISNNYVRLVRGGE